MRRCVVVTLWLLCLWTCRPSTPGGDRGPGTWYAEKPVSQQEREEEASEKVARVRALLQQDGLRGILIRTAHNFAWITAGSSADGTGDESAFSLFIRADGAKYLIARRGESSWMKDEELRGLRYELREFDWYTAKAGPGPPEPLLSEIVPDGSFASDAPYPGARLLDDQLASLRVPLTGSEVRKYRWLGRRSAEAVEEVCRSVQPGMSERGIEALVSHALARRAIRASYIRVAADERMLRHGLAPASDIGKLEKFVTIGIGATRWGLAVAMTRSVHFGPPPEDLRRRLRAAAQVNAGLWARTSPGTTAGSLISGAISDYAGAGYPGEWRTHSQGGAIGYRLRDWPAVPGPEVRVHSGQAFAWSPTVEGVRVEDTILVLGDRLEVLTEIPGWPVAEARASGRIYRIPSFLVR